MALLDRNVVLLQRVFPKGYLRNVAVPLAQSIVGIAAVALLTTIAYSLHFEISSAGFLYLLIVLVVAMVGGFWQATATSIAATLCLNYFFVTPTFSFYVSNRQDWLALGVFEITAVVVSRLSARGDRYVEETILQKQSIEKLYELSRSTLLLDLHQAPGPQIVRLIRRVFDLEAVALFDCSLGQVDRSGDCTAIDEQLARGAYLHDLSRDDQQTGTSQRVLRLGIHPIGGLVLRGSQTSAVANALASLTAIALERYRSFEKESYAEAAHQSEELRTAVLDALAHAFKTPLTVIRTASSGLLAMGGLSNGQHELATLIDEQSIALNELATRLLQTARLEAEEIGLQKEEVVVTTLIDEVLREQSGRLVGHPVEVVVRDTSLATKGDSVLIATVVSQFVDNAAKYSTPGSTICVTAEKSHSEILISVHNEGPPIRIEDRDRIFERFYRCSESKNIAAGTGIGLSIAKKAADAHHGHVWVISGEAEGTTFFLSLPQV
jgi:two-component system, OmpR family, sensor histidine kinase KdpD